MTHRHKFVINFGSDAMASHKCMDRKSEIKRCGTRWKGTNFSLWSKDKDFRCKKIKLDGIKEIHCVRLWIIKNFLNRNKPLIEFAFASLLSLFAVLIFPVSSKTFFRNLIHAAASYLHLYPFALIAHKSNVKRLITIRLWMTHPIAQSVGMRRINLANGNINIEALIKLSL